MCTIAVGVDVGEAFEGEADVVSAAGEADVAEEWGHERRLRVLRVGPATVLFDTGRWWRVGVREERVDLVDDVSQFDVGVCRRQLQLQDQPVDLQFEVQRC